MTEQKPSVGRIVHYTSRGSADGAFVPECRAAVVASVINDQMLDLVVLNPTGVYFNSACQDEDEKCGGTWHWPEPA